jgi:hypothetical protein
MAITTINLDVNDICTSKMGENIALTLEDGTIVTFTREALDSFIADYEYIQCEERAEAERADDTKYDFSDKEDSEYAERNEYGQYLSPFAKRAKKAKEFQSHVDTMMEKLKEQVQPTTEAEENDLQKLWNEAFCSPHTYSVQSGDYLCGIDCAGDASKDLSVFTKLTIDAFNTAFNGPDIFLVDEDLLIEVPKEWLIEAFGKKNPLEW